MVDQWWYCWPNLGLFDSVGGLLHDLCVHSIDGLNVLILPLRLCIMTNNVA